MGARRHHVALLAALLATWLAAAPARSAAETAKKSAVPNRYGAIAYHRASQSWGVSYDSARERDASVAALRQCANRECEVVHKFKNGCAALADGPKAWAAASGATRDEAETKAVRRCGAGCKPLGWGCTR
jgi:hypothetical protein